MIAQVIAPVNTPAPSNPPGRRRDATTGDSGRPPLPEWWGMVAPGKALRNAGGPGPDPAPAVGGGAEVEIKPETIADAVRLLADPAGVVELRALDVSTPDYRAPHVVSGFFDADHFDDLAVRAARLAPSAKGVYMTLNPIRPELLARAANRARPAGKGDGVGDADVLSRRWLLIDADPTRPAGISASDAEKEAAAGVVRAVVSHLRERGWPEPIVADSGNGWHALYRIALPNDDESRDIVKAVLAALAARFDAAGATIDRSVFNAARVVKLYGTPARKGDPIPDRPHRMAAVVQRPPAPEVVPAAKLAELAAEADAPPESPTPTGGPKSAGAVDRARAYVAKMPPAVAGEKGHNALYAVASKLVVDFDLTPDDAYPVIAEYSSRCSPPWSEGELRHKLADAAKLPGERGKLLAPKAEKAEKGPTDAARLLEIAAEAEVWRTPERKAYATLPVGDHRENHALNGGTFKRWITSRFYHATGRVPAPETLRSVVAILGVRADEGEVHALHVRTASAGSPDAPRWFLDLGNARWEAVEITRDGWRVVVDPPVKFRRPGGAKALPTPVAGGRLDDLRRFVNIPDDNSWTLYRAWIMAAASPLGPYPILSITGEHGSAKSSAAEFARNMVDPNETPLRAMAKDEEGLWIAAANSGVLAIDNLSFLSDANSDALCRIATGGGATKRALYTDDDEIHLKARKPIILTGIEDVASRGDLLDRALLIPLPRIEDASRKTEDELRAEFAEAHPALLGALLDAMAAGLRRLPEVSPRGLPRMADFARWAEACSRGLGEAEGAFLATYGANRDEASAVGLSASPFATAVIALVSGRREPWKGTAEALLSELNCTVEPRDRSKAWPTSPRGASGTLRRHAPGLRHLGIAVEFTTEGHAKTRVILISPPSAEAGPPPTTVDPPRWDGLLDGFVPLEK